MALAGNKCDAPPEEWEIKEERVKEQIGMLNMGDQLLFKNTSAKTGEGVRELFAEVAEQIIQVKSQNQ